MALVLERKESQSVWVGDAEIRIDTIKGQRTKLVITAPPETKILRGELKQTEGNRDTDESGNQMAPGSVRLSMERDDVHVGRDGAA